MKDVVRIAEIDSLAERFREPQVSGGVCAAVFRATNGKSRIALGIVAADVRRTISRTIVYEKTSPIAESLGLKRVETRRQKPRNVAYRHYYGYLHGHPRSNTTLLRRPNGTENTAFSPGSSVGAEDVDSRRRLKRTSFTLPQRSQTLRDQSSNQDAA